MKHISLILIGAILFPLACICIIVILPVILIMAFAFFCHELGVGFLEKEELSWIRKF